jgi:hypothetical protein
MHITAAMRTRRLKLVAPKNGTTSFSRRRRNDVHKPSQLTIVSILITFP